MSWLTFAWPDRRGPFFFEIQLSRLRQNLAAKKMEPEVTGAARALLADKGYDPVYGAAGAQAHHPAIDSGLAGR